MSQITKELLEKLFACECAGIVNWRLSQDGEGLTAHFDGRMGTVELRVHGADTYNAGFVELPTQELLKKGCYEVLRDGKRTGCVLPARFWWRRLHNN